MKHIMYLYRFNSDVRKKYLGEIEKLDWDSVIEDKGASWGSIRDVFIHTLDAYRYWFGYVFGHRDVTSFEGTGSVNNMADMRRFEAEVDKLVMDFLENVKVEYLETVYEIKAWDFTGTLESILLHMIEEELQHRGELNCLLWQMDIDPPIGTAEDLEKAMK